MIPLFKPFMPPLPELESILYSSQLAYGRYARLFEEKLSQFIEEPYVLVTNSFSSAIMVALATFGVAHGDEVIASPMACLASTQPLRMQGVTVVWADIDPHTGTLSPENVRRRITPKTKLIIHNHHCGVLGYIDEINAIGKEKGIPVMDDGIEAFGGEYKGRKLGHVGTDVTVFSFQSVRLPNTIDGGAIIFQDKAFYEKATLIRDCGVDRKRFRDEQGEIDLRCDVGTPGMQAAMSDVNGYIGVCQMNEIASLLKKQRDNAKLWDNYFMNSNYAKPVKNGSSLNNYWVYGILAENKDICLQQFREKGYYASGVHVSNSRYSVFGKNEYELPGVEDFEKSFLALPCGWFTSLPLANSV